jgi:hypothetical protein
MNYESQPQKLTFKDLMNQIQVKHVTEYGQNIDTWALHQAVEAFLQDQYQGEHTPYLVGQSRLIAFDTVVDPDTLDGEELISIIHNNLESIHISAKRFALINKSRAADDMILMRVRTQLLHGQDHDTIMNEGINKWTYQAQKIRAEIESKPSEREGEHEDGWQGDFKVKIN